MKYLDSQSTEVYLTHDARLAFVGSIVRVKLSLCSVFVCMVAAGVGLTIGHRSTVPVVSGHGADPEQRWRRVSCAVTSGAPRS